MTRPAQVEQWRRARAALAHLRWARGESVLVVAFCAFIEVGLWRAGYPAPRLVALGAVFLALLGLQLCASLRTARAVCEGAAAQAEKLPPLLMVAKLPPLLMAAILLLLLSVAITGGLRSPLIAAPLAPISDLVIQKGWSRTTKAVLALVAGAAMAMAALPANWFGPQVPQPAFWVLMVFVLAMTGAIHTRYVLLLTRTHYESTCELMRAREEMMAQACGRARELERMGAKLAHELKNPLAAIKGLVQLSARAACDPDSLERLQVVEAEVERMRSILQDYLSFSRPFEELRPQPVALAALADEVLSILGGRAASAGVALRRRGDAQLEADPRRLREALHNLVTNALEASAHGGSIEVEIAERDGAAHIAVRDSGRGMPREVLERLGTPFFTTRDEGTGLGVVLARAAFRQHGGSLEYASAPGQGTTATATLPLKPAEGGNDGARALG